MAKGKLVVNLNEYGFNLSSRILAQEILSSLKNEILSNSNVILDFQNVKYVSYSFATEFVDYFYNNNIGYTILNQNKFIDEQIKSIIPMTQESKKMALV